MRWYLGFFVMLGDSTVLFFQRVVGKPDLFAILYDEVVCCSARREGSMTVFICLHPDLVV
jgi:hypothetical protein